MSIGASAEGDPGSVAEQIDDALATAAGVRNAAEAELVGLVGRALDGGLWERDGMRSPEHWVTWKLGASRGRAGAYVAIARRRVDLPHAFSLYDEGRLSTDQMTVLARHCPAGYDIDIANFAVHATVDQLTRSLREYRFENEESTESSAERSGSPASEGMLEEDQAPVGVASLSLFDDGFELRLRGGPADGLRIKAAIEQAKAWLNDADFTIDPSIRSYDAVMHLFAQGVAADPSLERRDRTRVHLHLDLDQRDRWRSRLQLGGAIDADLFKLLTCEADTEVVLSKGGRSPHLGRSRRTTPDWLRRLVLDRDGGCRVPGCCRTVGLDVHHITHWVDGGDTDSRNLVTTCRRHHTLVHQGRLQISGDPEQLPGPGTPDGLVIQNEHGRPLRHPPPKAAPPPSRHPQPPRYRHPTGEQLQRWAVHFNPNDLDNRN